ncbi:MAG: aminotransferase class I/II-fold pyridoxal phosphate-dependent enzyme [Clostridiales Family XIII bacterium]|jgi:DNA-binding transcriptional MocR family regulator|nr:aminotransferase class I/II-fold pyridoxal phosphate-dependent enzyme [Clostridiales Family XIII bacterium]
MPEWKDYSKEQLLKLKAEYRRKYEEYRSLGLNLDMSRGKPSPDLLDLSNGLLAGLDTYTAEDGADIRNYGVLTGIPECRRLFSDLLDIPAEQIIIGNNASLELMNNVFSRLCLFGAQGHTPWSKLDKVKFLCPSPGYDRHFAISEAYGAEMQIIPMTENGPDMDVVEELVKRDGSVKGIWCNPLYSNPQGIVYSDETVGRLAAMETKAKDFRIFWDNAYGVHHIYEEHKIADILRLAEKAGNGDRVYYFFSTSKITFPGGGISMMAASEANIAEQKKHISVQTIGYDKINQMRTVKFFKSAEGIREHMVKLGALIRPKFDLVMDTLDREFGGTGLLKWIRPKGGYFISVDTLEGCAKEVVAAAKAAGAKLTSAGLTFPYGKDPMDSNIRIAPTYPAPDELRSAMNLLCVCIKLVSADKLLKEK